MSEGGVGGRCRGTLSPCTPCKGPGGPLNPGDGQVAGRAMPSPPPAHEPRGPGSRWTLAKGVRGKRRFPRGATLATRATRATLLLLLAPPALAQPAPTWPAAAFNPRPLPDDLVLPLPCGGAMAFRRVDTPAGDGGLDDRALLLGSAETETGYIEYLRRTYLVGPFGGGAEPRHFWMSKYEVTRTQMEALRNPVCPAANTPAARLPAVEVSWLEAAEAAQRYSGFLARNGGPRLPRRGGAPAFVRLPTEAEWEYAARGGAAVGEAEFQARTFPMPEGPEAYAWFQGPRSAAGRLSPIGLKRPNPLGLHDMLGNAAEWALEPFRLNRVGRQHGLAGGLVARGGDYRNTGEAQLRSSLRIEYAPYDATSGEPTRITTVGFRFVLAAAAQGSLADTAALRTAFEAETRARASTQDDPAALIAALRREQSDPAMQTALDRLGAAYARETRERTDRARVAARAQVQAAAVLSRNVFIAQQRANGLQGMVENPGAFGATPQQAQAWRPMLAAVQAEVEGGVRAYAAIIAQLSQASDVPLPAELEVVSQELRAQNVPALLPYVALVGTHAAAALRGSVPPMAVLRADILRTTAPASPR